MEKFIPFEKLSKKKQHEINRLKRNEWGNLNPVTRKSENKKAYNRKKSFRSFDEYGSFFIIVSAVRKYLFPV